MDRQLSLAANTAQQLIFVIHNKAVSVSVSMVSLISYEPWSLIWNLLKFSIRHPKSLIYALIALTHQHAATMVVSGHGH
jgi:hypothetical protein